MGAGGVGLRETGNAWRPSKQVRRGWGNKWARAARISSPRHSRRCAASLTAVRFNSERANPPSSSWASRQSRAAPWRAQDPSSRDFRTPTDTKARPNAGCPSSGGRCLVEPGLRAALAFLDDRRHRFVERAQQFRSPAQMPELISLVGVGVRARG